MNYYNEIKKELINNEAYKRIKDYSKNRSDLETYYNVGKLLSDAGKNYGERIIKKYSEKLSKELGKKYNYRNLFNMRKFYIIFKDEKMNALRSKLSWTHYRELIKLKNINEIRYYISIAEKQNLSYRQLIDKIKSKEYERLPEETKNKFDYTDISEKVLQELMLKNLPSFLEELGDGFSFIKNEYKIKIGNRYNYIDLLLFNIKFNCYVVVELKVTELKKEHIGQIQTYMHYIDKNIKADSQNKTIGIIICKKDNKFIMEYCSDDRIFSKEYVLN